MLWVICCCWQEVFSLLLSHPSHKSHLQLPQKYYYKAFITDGIWQNLEPRSSHALSVLKRQIISNTWYKTCILHAAFFINALLKWLMQHKPEGCCDCPRTDQLTSRWQPASCQWSPAQPTCYWLQRAVAGSKQEPGMESSDKKNGMWKTRVNNLQNSNISISWKTRWGVFLHCWLILHLPEPNPKISLLLK